VRSILPRISEFFGIAIYMYWFDTQKHQAPHFHARYQGNEAVFTLEGARMDGTLGSRAHKLVEEWALENAADLRAAWQLAISGKEIPWITPLQ
jgi:hypothetical protein